MTNSSSRALFTKIHYERKHIAGDFGHKNIVNINKISHSMSIYPVCAVAVTGREYKHTIDFFLPFICEHESENREHIFCT